MPRTPHEARLQQAVAAFLGAVQSPGMAWTAVDAGQGKMDFKAAQIRKGRGVKAGWPDIQIVWLGRFYGIELKAERGVVSEAQNLAHADIRGAGASVAVARSVEDVERLMRGWGMELRGTTLSAAERDRRLAERAAAPVVRTTKLRQPRPTRAQVARVGAMRKAVLF